MSETLYRIPVGNVIGRFPDRQGQSCSNLHAPPYIVGIAIHHDAVDMEAGDHNYNGDTLDEDLGRLQTIYNYNVDRLGGFPYHLVATPNGRLFQTRELATWGVHVSERNHELLGLCLMGNFLDSEPGAPQLCAASLGLIALWRWLGRLAVVEPHRKWAIPSDPTECCGPALWIPKVLSFAEFNVRAGR